MFKFITALILMFSLNNTIYEAVSQILNAAALVME